MILITIALTVALVLTQVLTAPVPVGNGQPTLRDAPTEQTPPARCGMESPPVAESVPDVIWTSTEGRDGRRLIMPLTGWTWTEGEDGRRVLMPLTGWTWTEGADGRRVVYPLTGWTWQERADGRRFVSPMHGRTSHDHIPYLLYEALEITPEVAPYRELIMSQMGLFDSD